MVLLPLGKAKGEVQNEKRGHFARLSFELIILAITV